ncbi:expressed unknown protein [Seminavis robusta]|uniref:Uncharacterized protein n=1 Tax=Seminavis robusta TaxID=568900 RepID=A0A9N8DM71_9STRA|nr:expressed unknown protein [Seminavis robusta]|eukprot:Sro222_g091130.1 n/a (300) ;mRNA; r:5320-6219
MQLSERKEGADMDASSSSAVADVSDILHEEEETILPREDESKVADSNMVGADSNSSNTVQQQQEDLDLLTEKTLEMDIAMFRAKSASLKPGAVSVDEHGTETTLVTPKPVARRPRSPLVLGFPRGRRATTSTQGCNRSTAFETVGRVVYSAFTGVPPIQPREQQPRALESQEERRHVDGVTGAEPSALPPTQTFPSSAQTSCIEAIPTATQLATLLHVPDGDDHDGTLDVCIMRHIPGFVGNSHRLVEAQAVPDGEAEDATQVDAAADHHGGRLAIEEAEIVGHVLAPTNFVSIHMDQS